jgi:hypothetical protein
LALKLKAANSMAATFRMTIARLVGTIVFGAILTTFDLSLAQAELHRFQGPHFLKGLWHFERTLYQLPQTSQQPLMKKEMTRCVDPTIAMKGTFESPDIGNCHSAMPRLVGNRYVFPKRCDYMGPVKTEITVKSDSAYIEVNALTVGNFPREDKVVAQRIGDCDKLEVE